MKSPKIQLMGLALLVGILACTFGQDPPPSPAPEPGPDKPAAPQPTPGPPPSGDVLMPENLNYLGAFRLPQETDWEYSGHGLTYFPGGDPSGAGDGFPGSLFSVGHDHRLLVSEISIPAPVASKNLDDLNFAETLQPFVDITGGAITDELAIPRMGIEYLPPQGGQTTGKLHYAWGQHLQDFEASHGWAELTLSDPQSAGPWIFDGYTNYITNDYVFEIPSAWADTFAPGQVLATGRAREGPWSGRGPALFAYAPWNDGNPPVQGSTLNTLTPLLLYGTQPAGNPEITNDESMMMSGYRDADHWWGGAWLTAGDKSAVVFVGTKALGEEWYGYANGVVSPWGCDETNSCPAVPDWPYDDRGFWAESYQAQMIFYDPSDLASVAHGEMGSWEPQPYGTLVLDQYLISPELDPGNYKRDLVGAMAFDRDRGYIFVVERLADDLLSLLHVWQISQ